MKRLLTTVLVLVVSTSIVWAAAVKLEMVDGPSIALAPDATGQAVINYAKGADKTEVQLNVEGLVPGDEYVAGLTNPNVILPGTYTALPNGKLPIHLSLEGPVDLSVRGVAVGQSPGGVIIVTPLVP